jgi:1-acyl-sn-glycerol-3-phosphate acyltransferase
MKRIAGKVIFLLMIYTVGALLGIIFCFLKFAGVVRVAHGERIPLNYNQRGLLVVSNHPTMLEPILLPLLFFWDYLKHPFKLCPFSTPDKKNFCDRWYWWWLNFCAVSVDRQDLHQKPSAFRKMVDVLKRKGTLVLFPEGGRTAFATMKGKSYIYSQNGSRISTLDGGVGLLAKHTDPLILPIWVENAEKVLPNSSNPKKLFWRFPNLLQTVTLRIGTPFRLSHDMEREMVPQEIASKLLELADEPDFYHQAT